MMSQSEKLHIKLAIRNTGILLYLSNEILKKKYNLGASVVTIAYQSC